MMIKKEANEWFRHNATRIVKDGFVYYHVKGTNDYITPEGRVMYYVRALELGEINECENSKRLL